MPALNTQPTGCLQQVSSVALFLAVLDTVYHLVFHALPLTTLVLTVALESLAFTTVFFLGQSAQLTRITLAYLTLPYLLFLPFWLNTAAATLMMTAFIVVWHFVWKLASPVAFVSHAVTNSTRSQPVSMQALLVFLGLLVWVNLSGVGGYGFQTPDHGMHNGRLKDLIDYPWPVRYSENANLVYYVGYYLPAAALGKLFGHDIAIRSMLPWTLMGVTLAFRWLCVLANQRPSLMLVALFVLFGPQDIIGVIIAAFFNNNITHDFSQWSFWENTDDMDFWVSPAMPFFLGNFLSNTFQLYWAPHQIVAGWLSAALALQSFQTRKTTLLIFSYALLCLWSPTAMLALFPLILSITVLNLRHDFAGLFSFPNLFAVVLLTPLFLIFYTSGSALSNPYHWTAAELRPGQWLLFGLFHLLTWGLYLISCLPFLRHQPSREQWLAGIVVANFCLLSLLVYGEWSDLICRGAAPLSFCLFVMVLRAGDHYLHSGRNGLSLMLTLCLLAGSGSALLQNRNAFLRYGETERAIRGDQYSLSYQFLGPDDSRFGHYLRKPLSHK